MFLGKRVKSSGKRKLVDTSTEENAGDSSSCKISEETSKVMYYLKVKLVIIKRMSYLFYVLIYQMRNIKPTPHIVIF